MPRVNLDGLSPNDVEQLANHADKLRFERGIGRDVAMEGGEANCNSGQQPYRAMAVTQPIAEEVTLVD